MSDGGANHGLTGAFPVPPLWEKGTIIIIIKIFRKKKKKKQIDRTKQKEKGKEKKCIGWSGKAMTAMDAIPQGKDTSILRFSGGMASSIQQERN